MYRRVVGPIDELVSVIDAIRDSEEITPETSLRIVDLVRSSPEVVHQTLRALYEMQRIHPTSHSPMRVHCERCESLTWIISECESLIMHSLSNIDYVEDEPTAG